MKRPTSQPQSATKLSDHIRELQKRILVSVIALMGAGVLVYFFYEPLLNILRSPLGAPLYYTSPAGNFAFIMKICFMGGLAIAMPVLTYNLVMFVRPAFVEALTKKRIYTTAALSSVLAIVGAVFGFTCILPGTLHFFGGYQVGGLSALISADSYLNFVINIIITFVLVFQLPLLIGFIDLIKPLTPKKLFGYEKWVILGSLIISLVVPFSYDLVTSLLVALPIVVLFNLSIVIVSIRHAGIRRSERRARRATLDLSLTTESTLSLSDLLFEDLTGEIITNSPIATAHVNLTRRAGMDIAPTNAPPSPIEPAEWYRLKHQPIPLGNHVHLISDFSRAPKTNRVLTSQ